MNKESSIEVLEDYNEEVIDSVEIPNKQSTKRNVQIVVDDEGDLQSGDKDRKVSMASVSPGGLAERRAKKSNAKETLAQYQETIEQLESRQLELVEENKDITEKYNDIEIKMQEFKDKTATKESQFMATIQSLNSNLNELETRYSNVKDD